MNLLILFTLINRLSLQVFNPYTIQIGTSECECLPYDDPVCGTNGQTYPNFCFLKCSKYTLRHRGACKNDCMCSTISNPVCGVDGKTYDNQCKLDCQNVELKYAGTCNKDCKCQDNRAPVCGQDGNTYQNECIMLCQNVQRKVYDGECVAPSKQGQLFMIDCICTQEVNQVCGLSGKTYDNECTMNCAGDELAYQGKCLEKKEEIKEPKQEFCYCSNEYDPVCGKDNQTYSNRCLLKCSKIDLAYGGQCQRNDFGVLSLSDFLKTKNN